MKIAALTIYELSIPLRVSFRHSLAERERSQNIVVRVELEDGTAGFGEGMPVPYVTGETVEDAVEAIGAHYFPAVRGRSFSGYEEVGKRLGSIQPVVAGQVCHTSAKCAFELAVLDAFGKAFGRSVGTLGGLVELPAPRAAAARATYGVALTADADWIRRKIGLLKLYGFRDFKLKVGIDAETDRQVLSLVARRLRRRLARGRATLRVDANGAYPDADTAFKALEPMVRLGVECVEQPMPSERDGQVAGLAERLGVPILLDESVRTIDEARERLSAGARVGLNIRLSKNGGFFDSLRLAALCRERGAPFQLGCHVGETGILAAAQRHLLDWLPDARYVEGAFGTHLLDKDIVHRSVRVGYGGRPPRVGPIGLGIDVDERILGKFLLNSRVLS